MVVELSTVVFVIGRLQAWNGRFATSLAAMLLAVLCGKGMYYLLKALLLAPATLVSTPLWVQLLVAVVAAVGYAVWMKLKSNK